MFRDIIESKFENTKIANKGHKIGRAARFRSESAGPSGRFARFGTEKRVIPMGDRHFKVHDVMGQPKHPRLRTSPAHTIPRAPRFGSAAGRRVTR